MKLLGPLFDESTILEFFSSCQILPYSHVEFPDDDSFSSFLPFFYRLLLKVLLDHRAQSIPHKHIYIYFSLLFSCSIVSLSNRKAIAFDIHFVHSSVEYPALTPMLFRCCSSARLISYGVLVCSDILSLKNSRVISQPSSAKLTP